MKRIDIHLELSEDQDLVVSSSEGKKCIVTRDERTLKATDLFALFDDGADVEYFCENVKKDAQNLSQMEIIYNDCLDVLLAIVASINGEIKNLHSNETGLDTTEVEADASSES